MEDFTREELLEMIKNSILEHQVANIRLVNRAREFKDANMACAIYDAKAYMYEIVRPFYPLISELYSNEEWVSRLKELTEDAYYDKEKK